MGFWFAVRYGVRFCKRLSGSPDSKNPFSRSVTPSGITDYRKNLFFSNGSPYQARRGKKHF
jgi:hypothetical protein